MVIWRNLDLLKATRARTLELVQGLTQGQMGWEPQPGTWTAGEQLDHLRLAALLYHNQIAELVALANPANRNSANLAGHQLQAELHPGSSPADVSRFRSQ